MSFFQIWNKYTPRVFIKFLKVEKMSEQIDIKAINKLAEILEQHGLTELEYEIDNCRVCLTKDNFMRQPAVAVNGAAYTPQQTESAPAAKTEQKIEPVDDSENPNAVKSPMVGVVYLAPDTTKPNYVKVGSLVAEGDTVCLIEAMKTFNPVKAHKSGKVTKVLVETGDPIEYGQALIVIE